MRKFLAIMLMFFILVEVGSTVVLSQQEVIVIKTWIGSSIQITNLPNIGFVPHISLDIGQNIEVAYSFATMTKKEARISLEINFISKPFWELKGPQIGVKYLVGLRGSFVSQEEKSDMNDVSIGLFLGIRALTQIWNRSVCFDGLIGIDFSQKSSAKLLILLGCKIQVLRDFVFTI